MELNSLVHIFGGASITFYIMWLWLKSVRLDKEAIEIKLKEEQSARIVELKEMLPLLVDTSKGLQLVIKNNIDGRGEMIKIIKAHVDERVLEIKEICKKN